MLLHREDDHVYNQRATFYGCLLDGNAPIAANMLRLKASERSIRIFFHHLFLLRVSRGTIAQYGFSSQHFEEVIFQASQAPIQWRPLALW